MPGEVSLRAVTVDDLDTIYRQQLDPEANYMAAFTARDPSDRQAFNAHWEDVLADPTVTMRTILVDGQVAGSIISYPELGQPQVGYWLGKEYWGRGVATSALSAMLHELEIRPLYARAAKDNVASLRVLQKCGFVIVGEDVGFSYARGRRVEEFLLRLDADFIAGPRDSREDRLERP